MAYCAPRGIPLSRFLSWDQADQDAALAWLAAEGRKCPGCGTDPEDVWHAEVRLCPGCQRREIAQDGLKDSKVKGMTVRLARGADHECESCNS